ncbi:hypothetical protein Lal_00039254, partial [Lupinus albus]
MWDTLETTHEGTEEVKRSRLNTLSQEYKMFRIKPGKKILDLQKRFTHLTNHLIALGKVLSNSDMNLKVPRSLTRTWKPKRALYLVEGETKDKQKSMWTDDKKRKPKMTSIMELKDLDSMALATIFGKLQEHEIDLGRLTLHEESKKCKKGISLKASTSQDQEEKDDDESDSEIDTETMKLLVRKFNKFLKKKGSSNRFQRKETRNPTFKNKNSKDKFLCHECGTDGHMKYQCPVYLKKLEGEKNTSRDFKSKKAYIVWDVPEEDSTTSTSGEEETAKICLMVNDHEDSTSSKVDEFGE